MSETQRYFIADGYDDWWKSYSELPPRDLGDRDEVLLDAAHLSDLQIWVNGVGAKAGFGCYIPTRFILIAENMIDIRATMSDELAQLRHDLAAIRYRGARVVRMEVTPHLLKIAEVTYTMVPVKPDEPRLAQQLYGVPFEVVASLPDGLLYHLVASDEERSTR